MFILLILFNSSNCIEMACVLEIVLSAGDMQMSDYHSASGLGVHKLAEKTDAHRM